MSFEGLLVRQCKDSFIRIFNDVGYITSQLTKHDRVYDEVGAIFLSHITRAPKTVNHIVREILPVFSDVSEDTLKSDFIEFISDLEKDLFVVTGETVFELSQKEPSFSYNMNNPKTITFNFMQIEENAVFTDTADFFYEKFRQEPRIFGLQVEVTSHCNEGCIHCYLPPKRKRSNIDTSLLKGVLDQAKEMGTVGLVLSGGEFFLHKDVEQILNHSRRNDFVISILSNGTLLNDDVIDLIKDINISLIQISLYSMKPEEHDAITQVKGSFKKTLRNIEKLIDADVPAQISCPVMKTNRGSYLDVLTWAYRHKIKAQTDFIIMARSDLTTSNLENRIDLKETNELIREILLMDEDYRALIDLQPRSLDSEKYAMQPVCGVGVDSICLTANGNYYPCAGWQGYVLGNAYERSLKDVWGNSDRIKFLRSITKASFPKCLECGARDFCSMCMVRNFNESGGDMFCVNEHFCSVAFQNKKLVEEYKQSRQSA